MRHNYLILLAALFFVGCSQEKPDTSRPSRESDLTADQPVDSILKHELEQIGVEDQTLRLLLPDVNEKFGKGSDQEEYIWTLIHKQDSICLKKTLEILDNYGWVDISRVGISANQALWLVIQHADLAIQEKYLPLLKESVIKGESQGWHLAFLEDRILMRNNKAQIYGSQAIPDKTTGKMKIYPIEDVKNVNTRRAELGLEPIEEFAEKNAYVFDQEN